MSNLTAKFRAEQARVYAESIRSRWVAKILADDNESSKFMRDVLLTMPDSTAELSKAHDARARELQRLFRIGDDFAFCAAMRAAMNADIAVYVRDRAEDEANREQTSMPTATFLRKLDGWRGDARLYKLSVPMKGEAITDEQDFDCEYVVVSAVVAQSMFGGGPETFIFAADESGEAINLLELPGSFIGALDHAKALLNAGYSVQDPSPDCNGCRETLPGKIECCLNETKDCA